MNAVQVQLSAREDPFLYIGRPVRTEREGTAKWACEGAYKLRLPGMLARRRHGITELCARRETVSCLQLHIIGLTLLNSENLRSHFGAFR